MNTIGKICIILMCFLLGLAVSFTIYCGLAWVVCWAFTLVWNWKTIIGVYAILWLVSSIFASNRGKG